MHESFLKMPPNENNIPKLVLVHIPRGFDVTLAHIVPIQKSRGP